MKPIIFSAQSIPAILDGRKTQARMAMKPQPTIHDGMWDWKDCQWMDGGLGFPASGIEDHAPYRVGDALWVREAWQWAESVSAETINDCGDRHGTPANGYVYKADARETANYEKWRSPVGMPCEAARLFLRVKDVRVERVQEISEADARAEGIESYWAEPHRNDPPFIGAAREVEADLCSTRRKAYQQLWDFLNEKRGHSWESNPWAWAYEFERITREEAEREG